MAVLFPVDSDNDGTSADNSDQAFQYVQEYTGFITG